MKMARVALILLGSFVTANASRYEAVNSNGSPVGQVVKLLKQMQDKGKEDKASEAKQYAVFEQWCTSTKKKKDDLIKENGDLKTKTAAQVATLKAAITAADTAVENEQKRITGFAEDKDKKTKARAEAKKVYDAAHRDYTQGIKAISSAMNSLSVSFLQLSSTMKSGLSAQMPDEARARIEAFISESEGREDEEEDGDDDKKTALGGSGKIKDMLSDLKSKFMEERGELETAELGEKHAHTLALQDLDRQTKAAQKVIDDTIAQKQKNIESKATKEGEITQLTKAIKDDTDYVEELVKDCNAKKDDFKKRQEARDDELEALKKAQDIMEGDKVKGHEKKHLSLMQVNSMRETAAALAMLRSESSAQWASIQKALVLLRTHAQDLNSQALTALALRADSMAQAGDPLAKVRKMITDLIARMQEEAAADAEKHGWCKKELATNEQTRTTKAEQVEGLQAEIATLTSDIAALTKQIADATADIAANTKALTEATAIRAKEKEKNEDVVEDAKEAQTAVAQAMTALKGFYGKKDDDKKEEFLQMSTGNSEDEARADPKFEGGEYKGMGGGGIIAMLEVVQSNFEKLESDTKKEEAASLAEFNKFKAQSLADKAAKEKEVELKTASKKTKTNALADKKEDLAETEAALKAANAYFEELKPQCINTGETLEQKMQKRKEEIESLKEVLEVLENSGVR
eukprot:TRINITY_DN62_c0_g1_i2.p1 TRINITY_DN62_c0_g1~~TRINITY_DN62_c0_g1_i2.p1  ORF type:complete len:691 (-),score=255.83 TRINITY_DN62_c0_g1_i2:223-2295(-)